jgi:hypothetical protein
MRDGRGPVLRTPRISAAIAVVAVIGATLVAFVATRPGPGSGDVRFDWTAAAAPPDSPILTDPLPSGEGLLALAASGRTSLAGETAATAWTTSDGSTWSRLSDEGAISVAGRAVEVVAACPDGGTGFVAAGSTGQSSALEAAPAAAIWHSLDGRTWDPVPVEAAAGAGIVAVAARPGAMVALGLTKLTGQSPVESVLAWHSGDGAIWRSVAIGSPEPLVKVVDFGGSFVALGSGPEASVWISSYGQSWSLAASLPGDFRPTGTAQLGDRLVAVANVDGRPEAVSTADARTWTRADLPVSSTGATVGEVVAVDGRLIAFGSSSRASSTPSAAADPAAMNPASPASLASASAGPTDSGAAAAAPLAWISDDGLTWRPLPSGAALPGPIQRAAALGDRLVVTVAVQSGPAVFVGTPAS